jgi:hypothetical protein
MSVPRSLRRKNRQMHPRADAAQPIVHRHTVCLSTRCHECVRLTLCAPVRPRLHACVCARVFVCVRLRGCVMRPSVCVCVRVLRAIGFICVA